MKESRRGPRSGGVAEAVWRRPSCGWGGGEGRGGAAPAAGEAPGDPRPLPVAPAARGGGEGRGCGRRTARLWEEEEEVVREKEEIVRAGGFLPQGCLSDRSSVAYCVVGSVKHGMIKIH